MKLKQSLPCRQSWWTPRALRFAGLLLPASPLCFSRGIYFLCSGHAFCFTSVLLRCFSSSIAPNKAAGFSL